MKIKKLAIFIIAIAMLFGGCESNKRFYCEPCIFNGTVSQVEYRKGIPICVSRATIDKYIIASLRYEPNQNCVVATMRIDNGDDTYSLLFDPEAIVLKSDNEKIAYRYSADEWLDKLENEATAEIFALAFAGGMESFSAGMQRSYSESYNSGSINSGRNTYYYNGYSSSSTYGNNPVAEQMAANRNYLRMKDASNRHLNRISYADDTLLKKHTLPPNSAYYGEVYFKKTNSPYFVLYVDYADKHHVFVFLNPTNNTCDDLPPILHPETKRQMELITDPLDKIKFIAFDIHGLTEDEYKIIMRERSKTLLKRNNDPYKEDDTLQSAINNPNSDEKYIAGLKIIKEICIPLDEKYGSQYRNEALERTEAKFNELHIEKLEPMARKKWVRKHLEIEYQLLSGYKIELTPEQQKVVLDGLKQLAKDGYSKDKSEPINTQNDSSNK